MEERILKSHKISLFNRNSGLITGVKDVISFDLNEIILDTEQGILVIAGEELHVTKLTVEKGEVEIEGIVYSMVYSDDGAGKNEGGSLLRRLFH
ncbi:MAG: sporulation protein YabP [Eubacterium sp.]|nr:sporulation protein YabP [Eubacterium sp.]MDD7209344.1 sporulation protein YabP [Lachnospiraceae bacterium]MDY5497561.1 sporulation protein YabP [Anaerobutyricum sp.]